MYARQSCCKDRRQTDVWVHSRTVARRSPLLMDLNIQLIYTLSMGVAINDRRYAAKEWSQA